MHVPVLELLEDRFLSRSYALFHGVDELVAQIAANREPVYYQQAQQPPWKSKRPQRGAEVDTSRPLQRRSHIKFPETVAT